MFSTEVDRFHAVFHHRGWGQWTPATAAEFLASEREAIAELGVPVGDTMILFDASDFAIQSAEVIELLTNPANPLYNCKRGAFVTPKGFGRLQVRLGNPFGHIDIFATETEAWAFLREAF